MEEKPEVSGQFSISYGVEKPITSGKRNISVQIEKLSIFRFLLDQIKSQTAGREGRVAKRKIDVSSLDLWNRFKKWSNGSKTAKDYRVSYRMSSQRLHESSDFTNQEKVDLYYALDIKIPKPQRQAIIDEFKVEINDEGVITGSQLLEHWDLVHPDSEREDENDVSEEKRRKSDEKWSRFTEKDDGVMWEFVLSHVRAHPNEQFINGKKVWEEFQKEYKNKGASCKRAAQTYSQRFSRILAPNLHLMPFDIETKAAIYENTKITVPEEFREQLIAKTNVTIDEHGTVIEYPKRPKNLVLQATPIDDLIGFTSPNRISTLIHPKMTNMPQWSIKEDKQIWAYVLLKMRNKFNKVIRAKNKLSGWLIWREFVKDHKSERTWQSLCQHFNEDLMHNIMETNFPISTKIQLLFICNSPLDEDDKKIIEPHCTKLVLNTKGGIDFAVGPGFRVGKMNFNASYSQDSDEELEEGEELDPAKILEKFTQKSGKVERNGVEMGESSITEKSMKTARKYAPNDGRLTLSNIGDFMKNIQDKFNSEKKSIKRPMQDYKKSMPWDGGDYEPRTPAKKRSRRVYEEDDDEDTRRRVADILNAVKVTPKNSEDVDDFDNVEEVPEDANFVPMSLEDLAENAKNLAERLNMAQLLGEVVVKEEPMEEEGYGLPPQLWETKPSILEATTSEPPAPTPSVASELEKILNKTKKTPQKVQKVQKPQEHKEGASKSEIDYAFSRIENEIRIFQRTLKSGAQNLTEEEREEYFEKIETLSTLFLNNSQDALTPK